MIVEHFYRFNSVQEQMPPAMLAVIKPRELALCLAIDIIRLATRMRLPYTCQWLAGKT